MSASGDTSGVVYEVSLDFDLAIERELDTWLRDHVADLLALPGFLSAEIFVPPDSFSTDTGRRTVMYRLRDEAALEEYLRSHAAQMRARGVARFGNRMRSERRTLHSREQLVAGKVSTDNCRNCGEVLTGQYCAHCGQRSKVRIISLWELLKDLIGDLVEWDSRTWRTLRPLLLRPGLLTLEYLSGRRAHYTPPFRLYLVLSVVFFLIVSISSDGPLELHLGDGEANIQISPARDAPDARAPVADAGEATALDRVLERMPHEERAETRAALEQSLEELSPEEAEAVKRRLEDPCSTENLRLDVPGLESPAGRLREACRKIIADSGAGFGRALWENIPKMMFIFLPIIALVNKTLYIGSRRYYVEHLLFFVHFHAFFFLAIALDVLVWRTTGWLQGGGEGPLTFLPELLTATIALYVPIYLYKAMRRVYDQGRFFTLLKFSTLIVAYFFSLLITFLGVLAYTALTL